MDYINCHMIQHAENEDWTRNGNSVLVILFQHLVAKTYEQKHESSDYMS